MRFMYVVKELTHADAARLTRIDYDREMALVALRQRVGQAPGLCGVARFGHGFDRARAEFAIVLLRDATGIGLGSLVLRRLIDHARRGQQRIPHPAYEYISGGAGDDLVMELVEGETLAQVIAGR